MPMPQAIAQMICQKGAQVPVVCQCRMRRWTLSIPAMWFSITRQQSMTICLAILSLCPAIICGQSPSEKQIIEELQKLNQRLEKIEKKLDEKPPLVSSHIDPEKKIFGMQFARGPKGNRVMAVMQGSPADKAGVRPG